MSWLWWGAATWLAMDIAACAWWARHRSREKRCQEIRDELRGVGRGHDASLGRDHLATLAGRRRIVQAALDQTARNQIPHQIRRTEDPQ